MTPWTYCSNALVPIECSRSAQRDCMGCFVNGNNGVYEWLKTTFRGQALKSAAVLVCYRFSKIFFLRSAVTNLETVFAAFFTYSAHFLRYYWHCWSFLSFNKVFGWCFSEDNLFSEKALAHLNLTDFKWNKLHVSLYFHFILNWNWTTCTGIAALVADRSKQWKHQKVEKNLNSLQMNSFIVFVFVVYSIIVFDNRQAKRNTIEPRDGLIIRSEWIVLICSSAPSSGIQRWGTTALPLQLFWLAPSSIWETRRRPSRSWKRKNLHQSLTHRVLHWPKK